MVLNFGFGDNSSVFKNSPEDSQFDIYEGNKKIPSSPTSGGTGVVPIGCILAHAQNIAGCPAIPAEFQKCDGSVINDAESPMNGENTPNLNSSTDRFLRGQDTSGGTGGSSTATASGTTGSGTADGTTGATSLSTAQIPSHTHALYAWSGGGAGTVYHGSGSSASIQMGNDASSGSGVMVSGGTGSGSSHTHSFDDGGHTHSFSDSHENKPPYYNVVWIIRIK